jgi:hypothetical protein
MFSREELIAIRHWIMNLEYWHFISQKACIDALKKKGIKHDCLNHVIIINGHKIRFKRHLIKKQFGIWGASLALHMTIAAQIIAPPRTIINRDCPSVLLFCKNAWKNIDIGGAS